MIRTGTQRIETDRLLLRRFVPADAEDMYNCWASDQEVTKYLTWPAHSSVEVSRMVLSDWVSRYEDGSFFNWAIEWKKSGRVIGNISVVRISEPIDEAEIGYCMGRAYWGQGIMPEALKAVMDYLFDAAGFNRIVAGHDVNNPKSGRVMEKAGMKAEGVLRGAGKNNQGICDVVLHSMLRSDRRKAEPEAKASEVSVRLAAEGDLERVNELRKQVNDLHVSGVPAVFKPGFPDELRNYIHEIMADPRKEIVVAEFSGQICGFAVLNHITRPETPFMYERDFLDIDELAVDTGFRRRGVGKALLRFARSFAESQGIRRIELNMWEFNRDALSFYEAGGFRTYRRYMEIK